EPVARLRVLEKNGIGDVVVAQAPCCGDDPLVRRFREHNPLTPATDLRETGFESVHCLRIGNPTARRVIATTEKPATPITVEIKKSKAPSETPVRRPGSARRRPGANRRSRKTRFCTK